MTRFAAVLSSILLVAGNLAATDLQLPRQAPNLVYNLPGKEPQELSQYLGKVGGVGIYFYHLSALPSSIACNEQAADRAGTQRSASD